MEIPNEYKNAGIAMLIAGLINMMLAGLFLLSSFCLCLNSWLTVLTALGELIVGGMILSGNRVPQAKVVSIAGLVGALLSFSMVGVGLEAFALMMLGKPEVEAYLKS